MTPEEQFKIYKDAYKKAGNVAPQQAKPAQPKVSNTNTPKK